MKIKIHHGYHDGRHGVSMIVGTEAEVDAYFWADAFEHSHNIDDDATAADDVHDDLAAFKAYFDSDLSEAMAQCRSDVSWQTDWTECEVDLGTIKAPAGIVEAARLGAAALKLARDCFRSACADRTLARVKLALSSAKGAVRHAEGKAVRS